MKKNLKTWVQREWLPFNILVPFDSGMHINDAILIY